MRDGLFPVRTALLYVPSSPLGLKGKSFQGDGFFTADNPPFGAVFTYYLKESLKSKKELRKDAEKEAEKKGEPIRYPTPDELRAEAAEEPPAILLTVRDASGRVVRQLPGPTKAGFHRVAWDLRLPPPDPVRSADARRQDGAIQP